MIRFTATLLLLALACASRSDPGEHAAVAPAEPPAPPAPSAASTDAAVDVDAALVVPADARALPDQPRNLYPILETKVDRAGLQVTIGAGTDNGVRKDWKAYVVNEQDERVKGGDLVIVAVNQRTTIATTKLTLGMVQRARAHLAP
jgi:hypothetical protein